MTSPADTTPFVFLYLRLGKPGAGAGFSIPRSSASPGQPPRLDIAQALEQRVTMAERWHRLLQRTLRSLRELRQRPVPTVAISRAHQVNVGAQQLNAAQQ